ncbi:MAG: hypothetical protein AAGE94_05575 [Acidobacteriota bacterium]
MAITARFSTLYRLAFLALVAIAWTSGGSFFALDTWVTVEGEFGPEKHPWQTDILRVHGATAFLMMISFGAILSAHVPAGWRARSMRASGVVVITVVSLLVITAWLLYYLGDEGIRRIVTFVHLGLGLSLPVVLWIHLRRSARRRRRAKHRSKAVHAPSTREASCARPLE